MSHLDFLQGDDDDNDDPLNNDGDGYGEAFSLAEGGIKAQKSLVVFLIDCHKSMVEQRAFADADKPESYLQRSLKQVYSVCRDKVKLGRSDLVGVVLFRTKKKDNKWDHDGVQVAMALQEPTVESLSKLKQLMEGKGLPEAGEDSGKPTDKSSLELGIWCSQQTFNECAVKEGKRAMIVLSCSDDPLQGRDPVPALRRAQDCKEAGITIDVFPLSHARALKRDEPDPAPAEFDASRFYRKLLDVFIKDEDERWCADAVEEKLSERLLVQLKGEIEGGVVSRAIASLPWVLAPEMTAYVKIYALAMETKPKNASYLDGRTNKAVKTISEKLCLETGRLLMDADIETYFPYGASELPFSAAEVAECKALDMAPGLRLLGFTDASLVEARYNLRAPYFVRPDDTKGVEGGRAYRALWQVLLEDNKVALCSFRARSNVPPRFAALVPDAENDDDRRDNGETPTPDGFHLVFLPYLDDIRTIPAVRAAAPPTKEAVQEAVKLIKKVRYGDVDPTAFTNPVMHKHLAVLEALGLQDEVDEDEMTDILAVLEPDPEVVATSRVTEICTELKAAVQEDYDEALAGPAPKAKVAPKRKREEGDAEPDWKAMAASGELERETVKTLKEACSSLGLNVSGKKADLVERIKANFA
mmetsp:Transcript_37410/g.88462  ORF Transcript_37410/g.88462 Transcript_37410/m.88462 type:complete len:643 (-) Transcript_37410:23-1951(-)